MTINIEQEARRYARIVVTAMQSGYQGLYDARTETIYIADNLTPTQYMRTCPRSKPRETPR